MLKQTVYSTLADRRGTTIVEFALVALAFLALIFGIVEFSRVLWTLNGLHLAVQQAARWAAVKGKSCSESDGTTESFAADVAGIGIGPSAFALSCCDIGSKSNSGNKVVANYTIHLFVPYIQMSPRLVASDCYPRNAGT
jgi:Flp pilus assembly protein TadG